MLLESVLMCVHDLPGGLFGERVQAQAPGKGNMRGVENFIVSGLRGQRKFEGVQTFASGSGVGPSYTRGHQRV